MASNPLLALLNKAGSFAAAASASSPKDESSFLASDALSAADQRSPSHSTHGDARNGQTPSKPHDRGAPGSTDAASTAANALLQSLLSPSAPRSNPMDLHQQQKSPSAQGTPRAPQSSAANELLSLLSGADGLHDGQQISSPALSPPVSLGKPEQAVLNSPPSHQPYPSKVRSSPANLIPRSPGPTTVFDSPSAFDLLGRMDTNAANRDASLTPSPASAAPKAAPKAAPARSSLQSPSDKHVKSQSSRAPEAKVNFVHDHNLRASKHLAGLRASHSFEDEISSGLQESGDPEKSVIAMDLLAPQPAGVSSLYPAKLEIMPISILKAPQKVLDGTTGSAASYRGRWMYASVVGACGSLICYINGKSKIRIIDEKTGERTMITADGPIKSLFVNDVGEDDRSSLRIGAVSDKGILIWRFDDLFGPVTEKSAELIGRLSPEEGKTFVHAEFARSSSSPKQVERLYAIQDDGSAALFETDTLRSPVAWNEVSKRSLYQSDDAQKPLLSFSQSSDGSLVALVHGAGNPSLPLTVLLQSITEPALQEKISFSFPGHIPLNDVSFSALVSSKQGRTRALLLGFNRNTTLAFVDLREKVGVLRRIYRFDGGEKAQFNLVQWHRESATLIVFNSLRSSVFTLRPFDHAKPLSPVSVGGTTDDAAQTIQQIRSRRSLWSFDDVVPALRECAMQEDWTSFSADQRISSNLRLAVCYEGGIQSISLPKEATQQDILEQTQSAPPSSEAFVQLESALESSSSTSSRNAAPVAPTRERKENDNSGNERARPAEDEPSIALHALLANLERNIMSSITALPRNQPTASAAKVTSATPSSQDILEDVRQLFKQELLPQVHLYIQEAIQGQVGKVITEQIQKTLPNELRDALMRPDLNAHLQRSLSASIVAPIQRTAMDVVTRAVAPHFEEVIQDLTSKVEQTVEQNMVNVRKDIVTEQSQALLESEAAIRDLVRQTGQLTSMVEGLSRQNAKMERALNEIRDEQKMLSLNAIRPKEAAKASEGPSDGQRRAEAARPAAPVKRQSEAAPPPTMPPTAEAVSSPVDVEDALLTALSLPGSEQDARPLQRTLAVLEQTFGSAHAVLQTAKGDVRVSQAVNLALLHRLVKLLSNENALVVLSPEQSVPFIEACCTSCRRDDVHIQRVFDSVRREMIDDLVQAYQRLTSTNRAPWWTRERLVDGALRYLQ